jgi:hypothetical protein
MIQQIKKEPFLFAMLFIIAIYFIWQMVFRPVQNGPEVVIPRPGTEEVQK